VHAISDGLHQSGNELFIHSDMTDGRKVTDLNKPKPVNQGLDFGRFRLFILSKSSFHNLDENLDMFHVIILRNPDGTLNAVYTLVE
jgi:hypothetical protein